MANLVVTTLADENDSGASSGNPGGSGLSLREAIGLANADAVPDTITFAAGLAGGTSAGVNDGRVTLGGSSLHIISAVTINGDVDGDGAADITLDGDHQSRLFDLEALGGAYDARLEALVIERGQAGAGGGIRILGGALTIVDSVLRHNLAVLGGGIAVNGGSLTLINATLYANRASADGGAILNASAASLINVTLSGNTAERGGGLFNETLGSAALTGSTVSGNFASFGGGIYNDAAPAGLTLTNSILLGHSSPGLGSDLYGGATYAGLNIVGLGGDTDPADHVINAPSIATVFAQTAANPHTSALSGVLADNSGPVPTIAIRPGGLAHDAGEDAAAVYDDDGNPATPAVPIPTDARGLPRIAGNQVDIGATEHGAGALLVVTTLADELDSSNPNATLADFGGAGDLSLREALVLAQQDAATFDTITFAAALTGGSTAGVDDGVLRLTQGTLAIATNVTIDGTVQDVPSIAIEGGGSGRVLDIPSGTSTLHGLTIQGGSSTFGSGILIGSALTAAAVTISQSLIRDNAAANGRGGGIAVNDGSTLLLRNSTVADNTARIGGGVYVGAGAEFTAVASTLSDNAVQSAFPTFGGAIVNRGVATLASSTLTGNSARYGGGIYNDGDLTLINTTAAHNVATYGGGLFNGSQGVAVLSNATLSGNFAAISGGIAHYGSRPDITNSIVAGNGAGFAPDLGSAGSVGYFGANVFSQAGLGGATAIHVPDVGSLFVSVVTVDPDGTPQSGDEFLAGVLANNGGHVQTIAIRPRGPAYEKGDVSLLPRDTLDLDGDGDRLEALPLDARGATRASGRLDVGAYEFPNTPPVEAANTGLSLDEGASATITAAQLDYTDAQEPPADVVYTITAAAAGTLLRNGAALTPGGTFTQDDIDNGRLSFAHDGSEQATTSFGFAVSDGGNPAITGLAFQIGVGAVNDQPENVIPALTLEANHSLALTGLAVIDPDASGGSISTTLSVARGTLSAAGAGVSGSGTASITITGTLAAVNAALAGAVYTPRPDDFDDDTLTMITDDGGHSGAGGTLSDADTVTIDLHARLSGTPGADAFDAPDGNARIDARGGIDTVAFDFALVQATVRHAGNTVIIDGPSSHSVLTGFERFAFTDGIVENDDGNPLVDDLFYYSRNHDVWRAGASADQHFEALGWRESRDPSAFFSTSTYLSANPDVAASGLNPLTHFHDAGWREGRIPSIAFDPQSYLAANPDVAAAQADPLDHYLRFGYDEDRLPFAPGELIAANGFDYVWYLNHNPDVAAAQVDAFQHFMTVGWTEGRNPNALFDVAGYLANYADVAAANINPLTHYDQFGWQEGRDPSATFDTTSYLAAYADVAAAHTSPLTHFLQFGIHEGRSPFADGVWG